MDYKSAYDNLIRTRKQRVPDEGVYYENHHIVMKSMGGSDELENLVKLTAREHFLAHLLLWKIHCNRKTFLALQYMCDNPRFKSKFTPSSRIFALVREECSIQTSLENLRKWESLSSEEKILRLHILHSNASQSAETSWRNLSPEKKYEEVSKRWSKGWKNLDKDERHARAKSQFSKMTPEQKSAKSLKGWETRKKNKALKQQVL